MKGFLFISLLLLINSCSPKKTIPCSITDPSLLGIITIEKTVPSQKNIAIMGKIYDKHSSEPIFGASVKFLDLENNKTIDSGITNEHGEFKRFLNARKFKIIITNIGYKQLEKIIEIPNHQSINLKIEL